MRIGTSALLFFYFTAFEGRGPITQESAFHRANDRRFENLLANLTIGLRVAKSTTL